MGICIKEFPVRDQAGAKKNDSAHLNTSKMRGVQKVVVGVPDKANAKNITYVSTIKRFPIHFA